MADLNEITNALAAQITRFTGLRAVGQAHDQITPPVAVVLPAPTLIQYGQTMDEAFSINLMVLLCISDAPPVEITQRALNVYLGLDHGDGGGQSVAAAILKDPSLGGTVEFCEPVSVSNYGRVSYGDITYFGAKVSIVAGAI